MSSEGLQFAQSIADQPGSAAISAAVEQMISTTRKVSTSSEMISLAAGIILTWIILFSFLSWDKFSSFYGRSTWASFSAVDKGSGSMVERAKAATLFVLQVLSVFLLAYASLMYYFSRRHIYILQIVLATLVVVISILGTSMGWLST